MVCIELSDVCRVMYVCVSVMVCKRRAIHTHIHSQSPLSIAGAYVTKPRRAAVIHFMFIFHIKRPTATGGALVPLPRAAHVLAYNICDGLAQSIPGAERWWWTRNASNIYIYIYTHAQHITNLWRCGMAMRIEWAMQRDGGGFGLPRKRGTSCARGWARKRLFIRWGQCILSWWCSLAVRSKSRRARAMTQLMMIARASRRPITDDSRCCNHCESERMSVVHLLDPPEKCTIEHTPILNFWNVCVYMWSTKAIRQTNNHCLRGSIEFRSNYPKEWRYL